MRTYNGSKHSLPQEFPVRQRVSHDREARRILVSIPKGWRFNSLSASEGQVSLSLKRVRATRKTRRATGYDGDRQRLLRA